MSVKTDTEKLWKQILLIVSFSFYEMVHLQTVYLISRGSQQ